MKSKIKIRTMKDDLANAGNNINDENEELLKAKQDQNKSDITAVGMAGSNTTPITTSNKLKDGEISELKNLIKRISEDDDKKNSEKEPAIKEDAPINMADEKTASEQQEQVSSKNDEKKELKNLIDKISETIEKGEDKTVQAESSDDRIEKKKKKEEDEAEKTEENKQSFWSDVSKKLKDGRSAEPQRINAIKEEDQSITKSVEDIKSVSEESKKEEYGDSGVIEKKEMIETKKDLEEEEKIKKNFYDNDDYQSPENRLIFGKQKKYSSVSKRIKLKDKKDEMEDLKSTSGIKEKQEIISEKEKYKKLKNRVIKKYNIKLFLLPWKKIIPISTILIILFGATYYVLVKELTVPPVEPPMIITGTEIEKFAKIKNVVNFTKNDIGKIGFKENAINEKFWLDSKAGELRIVIKDNDNIIPLKEALRGAEIETEDFPNSFWETTTESYNIFAIKTEENSFRLAVAIESNNIVSLLKTMEDWEQENVDKRKMFNVFEPFFTDSKTEEGFDQQFESTNYGDTHIRYINLPSKNISFDYFASDNTLIIVTSKENAGRIIDILNDDYYNDYQN